MNFRSAILALVISVSPLAAFAQLKIGYFNPKLALSQLDEYKAIEDKLQEFVKSREAAYAKQAEAFQEEVNAYQKRMNTLTEAKRKEEEARLATKRQELAETGAAAQVEIQKKQGELLKPLFDRISEAIKLVALEQKLDFVFNQATNSGENILLYVDEARKTQLDITDKVLAKLKKK
jgi:outer membrane protein